MAAFKKFCVLAVVSLATLSAAQLADQATAERVLGPRWRQMSRASGMIFSGTVLGVEAQRAGKARPLPLTLTKFRVDRAIAGVRTGEVVTVREWSGAWSMHRTMRSGQRMLIFLYPPSRLGLTSPVDGPAGQVALDARGEIAGTNVTATDALLPRDTTERVDVATSGAKAQFKGSLYAALKRCSTPNATLKGFSTRDATLFGDCSPVTQPDITLRQLERVILNARRNSSAAPSRIKE